MVRDTPIRILYLRDTLTVCGPGKTILNTWRTLDRSRYALVIAATKPADGDRNELLDAAARSGALVHPFELGRGVDVRAVRRLVALIRAERITALQTHDAQTRRVGVPAAKLTGIRHISSVHGWIVNDAKDRLARWADRQLLRLADAVIVVSDRLRQEVVAAGVAEQRVTVIHNAIVLQDYPAVTTGTTLRAELGIPEKAVVVSIVGRLSPEKGHLDFLAAAARVLEVSPEARFLIIGDGPLRASLESRVAALGLGGHVVFTGHQSAMAPYYAATDVLALASYTEGVPNVLLEAFAYGKPAVATAVGGVPEVLQDGRTGYLVPPGDPERLADRIGMLAKDPQLRSALGEAARGVIEERFSFDARTRALEGLYDRQLQGS